MNKLPKDIIHKLTEELSPQDFVSFCTSNTSDNVIRACNSNELWEKRLDRDFPYLLNIAVKDYGEGTKIKNPKGLYIGIFTRLSKISESFTETVLEVYGEDMQRFLTKDFRKFLYDNFYKFCDDILENTIFTPNDKYKTIKWSLVSEKVNEMYKEDEFTDFRNSYFPRVGDPDYGKDENYWELEIRDNITVFVQDMIGYLNRNLFYE